jgi:hypothetical protein
MVNTTTMKKEEEEEKKARVEPPLWALAAFEDCGLLEVRGLPLPLQRERERGAGLAHARVVLEVRGLPLPLQRERERERSWVGSREGGAGSAWAASPPAEREKERERSWVGSREGGAGSAWAASPPAERERERERGAGLAHARVVLLQVAAVGRGGRSEATRVLARYPLKLLMPRSLANHAHSLYVYLVTYGGGLLAGDQVGRGGRLWVLSSLLRC